MRANDKVNRPRLWSTRSASWLPFGAATEDAVLLADGTLVAALEVSPVDTALMSDEEIRGYVGRFWQGLRSSHFPVSIYVGTRRQEVDDYLPRLARQLDDLAGRSGEQDGFLGMLLDEQCRLIEILLREHLRSRYSLLVVSHNPSAGLKGAARVMMGKGLSGGQATPAKLDEAKNELDLRVKKIEDVLHHVGLKHTRCSGRRLAAEVLRLARPELAAEEMARLEASLTPAAVVVGENEGGSHEMAFSPQT